MIAYPMSPAPPAGAGVMGRVAHAAEGIASVGQWRYSNIG
jgi:hypothetical protein